MAKYLWTDSDKATLLKLYGKISKEKIGAQLGKPSWEVRSMAKQLGLKMTELWWTPEQEEQVRELYPTLGADCLAKIMGRTAAAISMRAHLLKGGKHNKKTKNKMSIGDERLNSHGLLVRKMMNTGNQWRDWKRVDVIEWEAINGPVPPGKVLARVNPYLPRSPNNMALFSKEELSAHFTGMHAPPEMRELMSLKRQILRALKKTPVQKASNAPVPD